MNRIDRRQQQRRMADAWLQDQFQRFDKLEPDDMEPEEEFECIPGASRALILGAFGAFAAFGLSVWLGEWGIAVLEAAAGITFLVCSVDAEELEGKDKYD